MHGCSVTNSAIEGRPEAEQEDGSDHGDQIREVVSNTHSESIFNSLLWRVEHSNREAKEGAEGVNDHTATNVKDLEDLIEDHVIESIEEDLKSGHDPELEDAAFAKNGTEGYQDSACSEVSVHDSVVVQRYLLPLMVGVIVILDDVAPEAVEENADLDGPAGDQVVEAD